jgi:putative PIG3 family NAD(P)H quinone oxidoreductase
VRAVIITKSGGPKVLKIREVDNPEPSEYEVLIKVKGSALNRADLMQRNSRHSVPYGFSEDIPGIEFAGEIIKLGAKVYRWQVGQKVFGITGGGAHAEYTVAHEGTVVEIPANLTWAQAAAIPEAFITAHDALWQQAKLRPSEKVLIHAVGSGVGLAAVQLVRAMNAVPYGTSRTAEKIRRSRDYGLEDGMVIEATQINTGSLITKWAGELTMDVILDLVGGRYVYESLNIMSLHGRIILVGALAGLEATLDLSSVLMKRLQIRGTVLRVRPLEEKIVATKLFESEVVPLLALGKIRPVIDSEFSLDEIQDAHRRLESNLTFGKVVIHI